MSTLNNHDREKVSAESSEGSLPEKSGSNDSKVYSETDNHNKCGTTQRGLKSRHIQLIALGGCIGTVTLLRLDLRSRNTSTS